jgi:hypothetical protein
MVMSMQSNDQSTTSYSEMHIWSTWLWIFTGIFFGAMIGVMEVKDTYYMIFMVSLYATPGGLIGGLISKFLPIRKKTTEKIRAAFSDLTHSSNIGQYNFHVAYYT